MLEDWDRPGFYDKVFAYGADKDAYINPPDSALGGGALPLARRLWATCEASVGQDAHKLMHTNRCIVQPWGVGLLDQVLLDIQAVVDVKEHADGQSSDEKAEPRY